MMRSNLVKLMAGPSPESEAAGETKKGGDNAGDEKRRRLIVDLDPPRFGRFTGLLDVPGSLLGWAGDRYGGGSGNKNDKSKSGGRNEGAGHRGKRGDGEGAKEKGDARQRVQKGRASSGGAGKLEAMFRTALNEDQRAAVRKLVTAKDYALLLGMPGTGKTWTIAFAVRVLLARGASVLITSYTHSAVDNLLLKLIEEGVPCLRVGKPSSVHPGVRSSCVNYDGSAETTAAYSELVASARYAAAWTLLFFHPLFSQRRFDYCVVDEAGQISQPVVLAPLRCADVFVLVGDHYQLPPLVTSSVRLIFEALEAGMSESLFRRLCEAHPSSLQRLSYQYRMNGDVMALCNDLTYCGRLRCGNAQVEDQRLLIPSPGLGAIPPPRPPVATVSSPTGLQPWLTEALDPGRRVAFLDTDALPFSGLECDVVRLLAWGLDAAGFDVGGVGVISPYRSQVQLLQAELKPSYPSLEINTIDKYQGRDKKVIVVSFVRSNAEGTVGHLLRDWRRLNVALSRAKQKLLLVGSLRTLSSCAVLNSLADILKTRGWVYALPPGAHRMYPRGLGVETPGGESVGNGVGEAAVGNKPAPAAPEAERVAGVKINALRCNDLVGGRDLGGGGSGGVDRGGGGGGGNNASLRTQKAVRRTPHGGTIRSSMVAGGKIRVGSAGGRGAVRQQRCAD
ncbi:unnamed protein product [Scytosiphon promiscuus]